MQDTHDFARNSAAARIFKVMSSEDKSEEVRNQIAAFSDAQLDIMAKFSGIPELQNPIHRALMRGQDNDFTQKLGALEHRLETGDVILMTGSSKASDILAKTQKATYSKARSSHIALVHADFICIDAMPKIGVTNRLISEIISDTGNDWRVIRCNQVGKEHHDTIMKVCAFYLAQPYRILPSRKPARNFSYCSELARKIYFDSGIKNCRIPKNTIIKPCDFDRIADESNDWVDVTAKVKPFIDLCEEYEAIVKMTSKIFIDGLKLNRARADERIAMIRQIRAAESAGRISKEKASDLISKIHEAENSMNFKFWDSADHLKK